MYATYAELIDCQVSDKVYVYNKKMSNLSGEIDKNMIGEVVSFEQNINEDWTYTEFLTYSITVKMKNGELINIKDTHSKLFFRKYEFITIKDLKEINNIEINEI